MERSEVFWWGGGEIGKCDQVGVERRTSQKPEGIAKCRWIGDAALAGGKHCMGCNLYAAEVHVLKWFRNIKAFPCRVWHAKVYCPK